MSSMLSSVLATQHLSPVSVYPVQQPMQSNQLKQQLATHQPQDNATTACKEQHQSDSTLLTSLTTYAA